MPETPETERVVGLALALRDHVGQTTDCGTCEAIDDVDRHLEHLAEAILASPEFAALVAGAQREAWDEGHRDVCTDCCCRDHNPYPEGAGDDE